MANNPSSTAPGEVQGMSSGQFLMWRLDLRMEAGVGIGKDLDGLDMTGDYPQEYRVTPACARARLSSLHR